MSSSISLRRSPTLSSCVTANKLSRPSPQSGRYSLQPFRSVSPLPLTSEESEILSGYPSAEKLPPTDGWRERSSLLRQLMADFSSNEIGATLFLMSAAGPHFQSVADRKRVLESSPFPLRTMDDAVANTSYSHVLTHTFFPTSTMSEASPVPYTPSMSCPMSGVSTPPMESFFSPLSLLPSPPSSMPVPAFMSSALSAGRLCRSPTFMRELGSTNPE